jgi:hypothetical protein
MPSLEGPVTSQPGSSGIHVFACFVPGSPRLAIFTPLRTMQNRARKKAKAACSPAPNGRLEIRAEIPETNQELAGEFPGRETELRGAGEHVGTSDKQVGRATIRDGGAGAHHRRSGVNDTGR